MKAHYTRDGNNKIKYYILGGIKIYEHEIVNFKKKLFNISTKKSNAIKLIKSGNHTIIENSFVFNNNKPNKKYYIVGGVKILESEILEMKRKMYEDEKFRALKLIEDNKHIRGTFVLLSNDFTTSNKIKTLYRQK